MAGLSSLSCDALDELEPEAETESFASLLFFDVEQAETKLKKMSALRPVTYWVFITHPLWLVP